MNILLIGPRGCGKSSIGQRLADIASRKYIDLDQCVLDIFNENSVQEVWKLQGESAWRLEEVRQLIKVLREDRQVISLGGGTVTIESAVEIIKNEQADGNAWLIYLYCEVAELIRRLKKTPGDRPSLTDAQTLEEEVAMVFAKRDPIYHNMADEVINVTNITVDEASNELVSLLNKK